MENQQKKLEEIDVIFDVVSNGEIPTNDSRDLINKNVNLDCSKKPKNYAIKNR